MFLLFNKNYINTFIIITTRPYHKFIFQISRPTLNQTQKVWFGPLVQNIVTDDSDQFLTVCGLLVD